MPAKPAPRGKKILIIGGGGREHALVWKLAQSPSVSALYASPGSDAIAEGLDEWAPDETMPKPIDLFKSLLAAAKAGKGGG